MNKKRQYDLALEFTNEWCESDSEAQHWYETFHIEALGMTAKAAIDSGYYSILMKHLESLKLGGFA